MYLSTSKVFNVFLYPAMILLASVENVIDNAFSISSTQLNPLYEHRSVPSYASHICIGPFCLVVNQLEFKILTF